MSLSNCNHSTPLLAGANFVVFTSLYRLNLNVMCYEVEVCDVNSLTNIKVCLKTSHHLQCYIKTQHT